MRSACHWCHGHIEHDAEGVGVWVACPHCSKQTMLLGDEAPKSNKRRLKRIGAILALAVLAVPVGFFLYQSLIHYGPQIGMRAAGALGAVCALAVVVFVTAWIVLWLFLPFVVYFGLRDILAELRKANAKHVSQLK